jgi:hypothetical protein
MRNLHLHHLEFRSAGGSDDEENLVVLCAWHHLRALHTGLIRIQGRAPEHLRFEMPLGTWLSGDLRDRGGHQLGQPFQRLRRSAIRHVNA